MPTTHSLARSRLALLFRSLATAVAPGGILLLVGHDASDFSDDSGHRAHLVEKLFSIYDVLTVGASTNVA